VAATSSNTPEDKATVRVAASLFDEYGGFIRAVIRFQAKNEFLVEELYQEFFLTLVAKPIPASVDNIKAYLYRAITNDVIDAARRRARRRKHLKIFSDQSRICAQNPMSADAILETEEESALGYWTRQLRGREAEAVTLRYRDNRSIGEIAEEMGIDDGTVTHYLSKGLRRLRRNCALE